MSGNSAIHRDTFWMLVGDKIGEGMSREVYSCKLFPDCVVKVEDRAGFFQNVIEWETWLKVNGTVFQRWFAPCRWISPNGAVLIMERTREPAARELPRVMPTFLSDFKRSNYGMIGNRLVCHDYGTHLMLEYGMTKRVRRVEWPPVEQ